MSACLLLSMLTAYYFVQLKIKIIILLNYTNYLLFCQQQNDPLTTDVDKSNLEANEDKLIIAYLSFEFIPCMASIPNYGIIKRRLSHYVTGM